MVVGKESEHTQQARALFPVYGQVEELEKAFACGHSYAVARNGLGPGVPGFIPLTPRHMTTRLWRALYWLDVTRLVIYGHDVGSLCDACFNNIPCLQAGRGNNPRFKCRVTSNTLTIEVGRKHRGRERDAPPPERT